MPKSLQATARRLLQSNVPPVLAARATGLSAEEVQRIVTTMATDLLAGNGRGTRPQAGRDVIQQLRAKAQATGAAIAAHATRCQRLARPDQAEVDQACAAFLARRPVTLCEPAIAEGATPWPLEA